MEILYFILLGIVQGLTEFLPVSSSGHLVLLDKLFGVNTGNFMLVSIVLHIATLFSVVILYRKEILSLIRHPFSTLGINLIISTFATVIIVLAFKTFFINSFSGKFLPICFMLTAVILMLSYLKTKSPSYARYKEINKKTAIIIGLVQGIAVLPGISRSGSTISTAVLCNARAERSTEYSFLLSLPIIVCSLVFEIWEILQGLQQAFIGSYFNLSLSFVLALVFGIFAIKLMKKLAKTGKYYIFSIYLIVISIFSLIVC